MPQRTGQLARIEDECKMQTRNEMQIIPTAKAVFVQGQGGKSPEVKRCGYCDMLVRWTLQEGRNVAVNSDGSRHQCLTDGMAKRKQPVRHARPSPDEVAAFLAAVQTETQQQAPDEPTPDSDIKAIHKVNVAARETQIEAMSRLADAMLKVAQSNNVLADSNRRLAKAYSRLAHVMERAGHTRR